MKKTKTSSPKSAAPFVQQGTQRHEPSAPGSWDSSRKRSMELMRDSFTSTTLAMTVPDEGARSEAALSKNSHFANKSAQEKVNGMPNERIEGVYSRREQVCRSQSLRSDIAKRVSGGIGIGDDSDTDEDFPDSLCEALRTDQLRRGQGDGRKLGRGPSTASILQDHQTQRSQQSPNNMNPASPTFSFSLNDIMECVEIV